ncbi:MAG: decaprenyl-phosphate phosphoribosyltransferase [Thermoplasmatota archaeon]
MRQGASTAAAGMRDTLRLLRPQQWYKNGLVLAGWVFSGHLADRRAGALALAGFFLFCLLSSGTYALNDALDAVPDRLHPKKRHRPVAAQRIPASAALGLGFAYVSLALAAGWMLSRAFFLVELAYFALQLLYLAVLRRKFLLDLASISGGFFLRSVAGVVLVAVPLSPWLLLCTLFLALFLGLGKRRHELILLGPEAAKHRKTLGQYTVPFLDQAIQIIAAALLVSYSLYTFFHPKATMMVTIPFVLYGLFRYVHLMQDRGAGGEPEEVFRDVPSLLNLVLWTAVVVAVLYGVPESFEAALRRLIGA